MLIALSFVFFIFDVWLISIAKMTILVINGPILYFMVGNCAKVVISKVQNPSRYLIPFDLQGSGLPGFLCAQPLNKQSGNNQ